MFRLSSIRSYVYAAHYVRSLLQLPWKPLNCELLITLFNALLAIMLTSMRTTIEFFAFTSLKKILGWVQGFELVIGCCRNSPDTQAHLDIPTV